jgi:hypothetical protein
MNHPLEIVLLALQAFHVIFLWTHDWIPLGRLNNLAAVRQQDPLPRLLLVTLIQSLPFTMGLFFSARDFDRGYPMWLIYLLWISYGLLFLGEIRAWWIPYLVKPDLARAERYRQIFGNTHSFLPERNGMVPNTLHIVLHLSTFAMLVALLIRELS